MLVLSRTRGESICIGKDIVITVTENYGGTVRIGIKAPRYLSIYRKEVYDRIQQEEREKAEREGRHLQS
jgi:carbon storage regulator